MQKLECVGLDYRNIKKKDGSGQWAISLVKFPSGDVAEIFMDEKDVVPFNTGDALTLECGLSVFNKKLGIKCTSLHPRSDTGKEK